MPITVQHGPGPRGVAIPALMSGLVRRYKEERARQDRFDMQAAQMAHQLDMQGIGLDAAATRQREGFDHATAMQQATLDAAAVRQQAGLDAASTSREDQQEHSMKTILMQMAQREAQQAETMKHATAMQQGRLDAATVRQEDQQEHAVDMQEKAAAEASILRQEGRKHDADMVERRGEEAYEQWQKQQGYMYTQAQEEERRKLRELRDSIKNDPQIPDEHKEAAFQQISRKMRGMNGAERFVSKEEDWKNNVIHPYGPDGSAYSRHPDGTVRELSNSIRQEEIRQEARTRRERQAEDKAKAADYAKQSNKLSDAYNKLNREEDEALLKIDLEEAKTGGGDDSFLPPEDYDKQRELVRSYYGAQRETVKETINELKKQSGPGIDLSEPLPEPEMGGEGVPADPAIQGLIQRRTKLPQDFSHMMSGTSVVVEPERAEWFQRETPRREAPAIDLSPGDEKFILSPSHIGPDAPAASTVPYSFKDESIDAHIAPAEHERPHINKLVEGIQDDWTDAMVQRYAGLHITNDATLVRFMKWYNQQGLGLVRGRQAIRSGYDRAGFKKGSKYYKNLQNRAAGWPRYRVR